MSARSASSTTTTSARAGSGVIVVGYDGSRESRHALEVAIRRAGHCGTVVAIHASPATSEWLDSASYLDAVLARAERERQIRTELAAVHLAGARLEVTMVEGHPAAALVREASSRDAAEIVVGARSLGVIRAGMSSVSRGVLQAADRPVLVVPAASASSAEG
jgi:nucleotide-binding universal stress UspA family protein